MYFRYVSLIESLKIHLDSLNDPRMFKKCSHPLIDVLIITILGILSHAESFVEIERWGNSKIEWLKKFLELPNGIPSHDTLGRVLSLIEPSELEIVFMMWVDSARKKQQNDILCIDGKVSRGTKQLTKKGGNKKLTTVSIFSTLSQIVLGQGKSSGPGHSESGIAIELLDILNIKDSVIVGDAGIGLISVANKVIEKGGNYIFPIKGNRKKLKKFIQDEFEGIAEKNSKSKAVEIASSIDKGHGRNEERHLVVKKISNLKNLPAFLQEDDYVHLQAIGKVIYFRKEKETRPHIQSKDKDGNINYQKPISAVRLKKEVRYFISSLDTSAPGYLDNLRKQWRIENQLHWVLDVSFGEDANKTRDKIVAENLATARKIAFNLVKQDKTTKVGIKAKLKMVGWDTSYLEKILFQTKLS